MLYFYVESAKYSAYTDKRTLHSIRCRVHRGQVHRVRLLSQLQAQGQSRRLVGKGSHVQLSLGRRHMPSEGLNPPFLVQNAGGKTGAKMYGCA